MESEFLCVSTFLGLRGCDELKRRYRESGGLGDGEDEKGPRNRIAAFFYGDDSKSQRRALKIEM